MSIQAALDAVAADAAHGDMVFPTRVEVALQVRRVLDDPDCSIEQLSKLVAADPLLSAKVVGLSNSVAYNPGGRAYSDVRGALSRIGFNALRSLATAVVVRQMRESPKTPELRAMSVRLWEHTTHVAALARVIAKHVTKQDPEVAFFAGIVHEVGSFFLLSRAATIPDFLTCDFTPWRDGGEAQIGNAVMRALEVPDNVIAALNTLWEGYLAIPPQSLGDTLMLADQLSPVESPLMALAGIGNQESAPVDFDLMIGNEMLQSILKDSAEEVASLTAALNN